jgi:hypothetical protein
MEILFELSHKKIQSVDIGFTRGIMQKIAWNARLIGIKGARGVGKTTLVLQYLKQNKNIHPHSLYVSLDHLWFSDHSLISLVDYFVKHGGTLLCIDEVHKYPNWSQEIKNIYDDYPELSVVFTGSSLLEILNARADLSRRAVMYHLTGLSFREYLEFVTGEQFPIVTFNEILENHVSLSQQIIQRLKPLAHFKTYLAYGYYPFFNEMPALYHAKINEVINLILEIELPLLRGIDVAYIRKLKQMLLVIGESVPFIANISKLSERIGINRQTFLSYLHYLEEIEVITLLHRNSVGITRFQKPDKIYLQNSNLAYSIAGTTPNIGNIRETFFLHQIKQNNTVTLPDVGDFLINNTYLIEVGGTKKTNKQIANQKQAYIAMDEIEQGFANKIPLWLFGFMY